MEYEKFKKFSNKDLYSYLEYIRWEYLLATWGLFFLIIAFIGVFVNFLMLHGGRPNLQFIGYTMLSISFVGALVVLWANKLIDKEMDKLGGN